MKYGMISPSDLNLFQFADTPEDALGILQVFLTKHYLTPEPESDSQAPEISRSRV